MFKALAPLVLVGAGIGLLWLGLSWVTKSPAQRFLELQAIAEAEQFPSLPPTTLVHQAEWLFHARLARLKSLGGLLGLVAVLGVLMGWSRRQSDALRGYRFASWTLGLLLLVGLVALGGFSLICPWPLPLPWTSLVGLATVVGLTTFTLAVGLPSMK